MLHRVFVNPADAEAVKSIPQGYAQETVLNRNKAVSLIAKMERMQLIPKGAFRVRMFREDGKRKVAIVHEGQGKVIQYGLSTQSGKIPSLEDVVNFIETQRNHRHDLDLIAKHFLGQTIDSHTDSASYSKMRSLAIEARELLERKLNGKFTEESVGHHKFYSWKPS